MGHLAFDYINSFDGRINIENYIISDNNGIFDSIEDIPVKCVEDREINRDMPVIIATMPKDYADIKNRLLGCGYSEVFTLA